MRANQSALVSLVCQVQVNQLSSKLLVHTSAKNKIINLLCWLLTQVPNAQKVLFLAIKLVWRSCQLLKMRLFALHHQQVHLAAWLEKLAKALFSVKLQDSTLFSLKQWVLVSLKPLCTQWLTSSF